jgi:cytochrome c oxidase subunit II
MSSDNMKYLLIMALILVGCEKKKTVYEAYQDMNKINPATAIEIDVLGKQWDWIFTYSNGQEISCHQSKDKYDSWKQKGIDSKNPDDMIRFVTIPINTLVNLNISSEKVLHSFAIPAFRVKEYAPVGKKVTMQFTAIKLGTYLYSCNEMCGIDHGSMVGYLRVVTKDEYKEFTDKLNEKSKSEQLGEANSEHPSSLAK